MFTIPISAHSLWQGVGQEVVNEQLESGSFPPWSHGLAEGSTNVCEMDTGEQGREEPSLWCQVLPLMFPVTEPDPAILTTSQSLWCPVALAVTLPSSLRREFLLGSKKKHSLPMAQWEILPSYCWHCACPVRKKSAWNLSKPLKTEMGMAHLRVHWIVIEF